MTQTTKMFQLAVTLNHHKYYVFSPRIITLTELMQILKYSKNSVVIECQGKICDPNTWDHILIFNNIKINTISIVGGG